MATLKCKDCGHLISSAAPACPNCGRPNKRTLGCGGLFIVMVALGTCIAVVGNNQESSSPSTATAKAKPAAKAPDFKLTATALGREYAKNEVRADAKYKGRTVEVSGIVHSVNKDILGDIYVVLGNGDEFDTNEVHCTLGDGWEKSAADLTRGYKAVLKGEVTGRVMLSAMMTNCGIVKYWSPQ